MYATLVCAQSKWGKTALAIGTKKFMVVCTEPSGSGWIKGLVPDYREVNADSDPIKAIIKVKKEAEEQGKCVFVDSLTALEDVLIQYITKKERDINIRDKRIVYASAQTAIRDMIRQHGTDMMFTCLTAEQMLSEKDESGKTKQAPRKVLKLSPALSGMKDGAVPISSMFTNVLVGAIWKRQERYFLTQESDNRTDIEKSMLPISDPFGIVGKIKEERGIYNVVIGTQYIDRVAEM